MCPFVCWFWGSGKESVGRHPLGLCIVWGSVLGPWLGDKAAGKGARTLPSRDWTQGQRAVPWWVRCTRLAERSNKQRAPRMER